MLLTAEKIIRQLEAMFDDINELAENSLVMNMDNVIRQRDKGRHSPHMFYSQQKRKQPLDALPLKPIYQQNQN
ncbi:MULTISPECIES: hypothetical protein [Bartonella]|uniref:hypothetical protein n=1 Tax=Bartonella TaxID=773 RepID=UPI0018DB903E|nr:hypothetical protein [Bartonella choladocola]MBI0140559.1 hypothetical protein [Bartonella choladocola]